MIVKTEIDGRPALVAYLNGKFQPVAPDDATMMKAIFTDDEGGVMFLTVSPDDPKSDKK